MDEFSDNHQPQPDERLKEQKAIEKLDTVLHELPLRQQQAFYSGNGKDSALKTLHMQ